MKVLKDLVFKKLNQNESDLSMNNDHSDESDYKLY
jgi:hypothetical protein